MSVIKLSNRQNLDLSLVYKGQIFKKKGDLFTTLGIKHSNTSLTNKVQQYITYEKTGNGCEIIITDIYDPDDELETERAGTDEWEKCYKQLQDFKWSSAIETHNLEHSPYYKIHCDIYPSMKAVLRDMGWPANKTNYKKLEHHLIYDQLEGYKIKIRRVFDVDGVTDGFQEDNFYYFFLKLLRILYKEPTLRCDYIELAQLIFEPEKNIPTLWEKEKGRVIKAMVQKVKEWLRQLKRKHKVWVDTYISYVNSMGERKILNYEESSYYLGRKQYIIQHYLKDNQVFDYNVWKTHLKKELDEPIMLQYKELMEFSIYGKIPKIPARMMPKHWEKTFLSTLL